MSGGSSTYKPKNPHFAFVECVIGDSINLTPIPPQHLEHFSYERTICSDVGAGNKIIMTVHDITAVVLEAAICNAGAMPEITFRYGYTNGAQSKIYKGVITQWDVDFQSGSAVLNLEGMSKGLATSMQVPVNATYNSKGDQDLNAVVRDIAQQAGWDEIDLEPIAPLISAEDSKKFKTFYCSGMTAPEFLNQVVAPYCVSKSTGQGGYLLYFDDSTGKVHFRPVDYNSISKDSVAGSTGTTTSGDQSDKASTSNNTTSNNMTGNNSTMNSSISESSKNTGTRDKARLVSTSVDGNVYESSDGIIWKEYFDDSKNKAELVNESAWSRTYRNVDGDVWTEYNDPNKSSTITKASTPSTESSDSSSTDPITSSCSTNHKEKTYELEWGTGGNSVVKSFNPNFSALANAVQGGGSIQVSIVNNLTNEPMSVSYDSYTNPDKVRTSDLDFNRTMYKSVLGQSSMSIDEAKTLAATTYDYISKQAYTADLVICGDPDIEPQNKINILVMTPMGVPHHSSGIYIVQTVVDDITGGTFETQCSLLSNMAGAGTQPGYGDSRLGMSDYQYVPPGGSTGKADNGAKALEVTGGMGMHRTKPGYDSAATCKQWQETFDIDTLKGVVKITANKFLKPQIQAIFSQIKAAGFDAYDVQSFCWRQIKSSGNLSYHSYGVAIDINPGVNGDKRYGIGDSSGSTNTSTRIRNDSSPVVQIFKAYGWGWGGRYGDYMHFSYFNGS